MRTIKIGSRKSRLAVIQTNIVANELQLQHPDIHVELITMDTAGDRDLKRPLDTVEGKGFFTQELEAALREGTIDLCVHSLKDTAPELPDDLPILAFTRREDPRDVLVLPKNGAPASWDSGSRSVIGCSSARRCFQLGLLHPSAVTAPVRGNVPTRIGKLDRGGYGALILAAAGLNRLGLSDRISEYFSVREMIPAAGQGILAIQGRRGFDSGLLSAVDNQNSRTAALAERLVIRRLNGGCTLPSAAYCEVTETEVCISALYCAPGCKRYAIRSVSGSRSESLQLAERLAEQLLAEVDS